MDQASMAFSLPMFADYRELILKVIPAY